MQGAELLDALPVAVYTTDAEGRITYFNEAAASLWGHRPEIGQAMWCGSWRLFWPDGSSMPHDECSMAIAIKEAREVRGAKGVIERPDGTRIPFSPCPTPLRDASGKVTGAINVLTDLSEQAHALFESERLVAIVASSDDAIISKTLDGIVTSWNASAERIFGYSANEMIGSPILRLIPPELQSEETEILTRLRRGDRVDHYETVRVTREGRRIDVSLSVSPVRDWTGRMIGAAKVARDITEKRRTERLQRLLVGELNHRVKNTLATVQAIATQTLRHSETHDDFVVTFSGRLQAMAEANALLTRTKYQGADVLDIVRGQLLGGGEQDARITLSGPLLALESQLALHLSLVLHELGTNARKYGALSAPAGRLEVEWGVRANGKKMFFINWQEGGGPAVTTPSRSGFGSTLIEQSVRAHDGEVKIEFRPTGVYCEIAVPLEGHEAFVAAESRMELPPRTLGLMGQRKLASVPSSRILIVEDEPLVGMDLASCIESLGHRVVEIVPTLAEALRLIPALKFDAALLDANLSGNPVDEIAELLTARNIPFGFVTGYPREALPARFRDTIIVSKPFNRGQLESAVAQLLDPGAAMFGVQPSAGLEHNP